MNVLGLMFGVGWAMTRKINRQLDRALGRPCGAGFRKNRQTVAAAHTILLAYARMHRARREIHLLSNMKPSLPK
jgi:hypothetical protein